MTYPQNIARTAAAKAMKLRSKHSVAADAAVDPVDMALKIGIQVHYEPLRSLEGLYIAGEQPRIVLGSERPIGRRNFTCAHELGHDAHGHATRVDELRESERPYDPDEFAADRFAAALLMPKIAVLAAFARRNWDAKTPTSDQVFIISSELGVGYSTMAGYMSGTLNLFPKTYARHLQSERPIDIRTRLVGRKLPNHLLLIDSGWARGQANMEVGDVAILNGAVDDPDGHLEFQERADRRIEFVAKAPGIAKFATRGCKGCIRIAPRSYRGLADYRHLSNTTHVQEFAA